MKKYSDELLIEKAAQVTSMVALLKELGLKSYSGASSGHLKRRLSKLNVDLSHWIKGNTGNVSWNRRDPAKILVLRDSQLRESTRILRRAMLASGVPHQCVECNNGATWNGKPLVLHIDHIDGNWRNNVLSNLRFLCPNCHSQTETWGFR